MTHNKYNETSDKAPWKPLTVAITILLAAILGNYYWFGQTPGAAKHPGPIEAITLGMETSFPMSLVWIAQVQGYFREEGLDLTIKKFDSGKLAFLAMLQNDQGVDIAAVAPTATVLESFKRNDFAIFATFYRSDSDIKIVARKDLGITNAQDLKGKKIGFTKGSSSHFFAESFLVHHHLSSTDVQLIHFSPPELPHALSTGRVAAISTWQPHAYNAEKLLGDRAVTLPGPSIYKGTMNFLAKKDFAKDHHEILKKWLRAIDRASAFAGTHREEALAIAARGMGQDQEDLARFWDEGAFGLSLDQSLLMGLEDISRWAINNKLTDQSKTPNYLDYLYVDALKAVDPKSVTIIGK